MNMLPNLLPSRHSLSIRASSFGVTLPFLLQQAAWLYERQLSQVRAQMRKVVVAPSNTPSPVPEGSVGSVKVGGQVMKQVGSGGAGMTTEQSMFGKGDTDRVTGPRVPSSLSIRSRDSPIPQSDRGTSSTPVKAAGLLKKARQDRMI